MYQVRRKLFTGESVPYATARCRAEALEIIAKNPEHGLFLACETEVPWPCPDWELDDTEYGNPELVKRSRR